MKRFQKMDLLPFIDKQLLLIIIRKLLIDNICLQS